MTPGAHISARFLWRYRFVLSLLVVLVTVFAARSLTTLGVSNSLAIWYPEDDPELANYRAFQATFGNDEIIVVAVSAQEDFRSEDGILRVAELTDRLLELDGVESVMSLVTVPESLADARGRLLSTDGGTTALVVQTFAGELVEARRHEMLLDIRAAVAAAGYESHLGGYGVVFDGLNEASTTGAASLIFYAHLVMVIVLAVFFRRVLPVLLTLAAVGVATTWTMGLYAAIGHQLNMITMVLPTLVLVIGIADCMHVLRSVAAQDPGLPQQERVILGVAEIIGPCLLMTVTTAAGFLGLTAAGLPVVRQLGWFGATGMISAFVASMVLLTACLSWRGFEPAMRRSGIDRLAEALHRIGSVRPMLVVGIFACIAVISAYGMSQLNSDTDSIGYLKKTHTVRRDSDFIESRIGPYVPIEFTVTGTYSVFTPQVLDAVWDWQRKALALDNVGWSWSLIDALNSQPDAAPSSIGMENLRRRLERMQRFSATTVRSMIAGERQLRVSFGAPVMSARSVRDLIEQITAAADLPPELIMKPAGYSPLYTRIVDEIVSSQVRGFAAAIALIVVLIGLGMRSWRRMLLALPANAVPVLVTLGIMGLSGIPLDVASATIASVILGLVVDDTVHLLRPAPGIDTAGSLRIAARRAGGTLMMTSIVLAAGFLVLGLAEIRSIAWFGVLTSIAMIVAIVSDLTLLPALARLRVGRQNKL